MAIGSDIVAKAMKHEGVTDFFYIMGAPMLGVEKACMTLGLRGIDVRHEQAAAMAGFAYSRLLNRPSFCMAASGPGVTNLLTGIAHAWADCTPVIALGGAAPVATWHRGAFQDIDQLAIFKPCTKWSDRVHHVRRIPELIHLAVTQAMTGKPGRSTSICRGTSSTRRSTSRRSSTRRLMTTRSGRGRCRAPARCGGLSISWSRPSNPC